MNVVIRLQRQRRKLLCHIAGQKTESLTVLPRRKALLCGVPAAGERDDGGLPCCGELTVACHEYIHQKTADHAGGAGQQNGFSVQLLQRLRFADKTCQQALVLSLLGDGHKLPLVISVCCFFPCPGRHETAQNHLLW